MTQFETDLQSFDAAQEKIINHVQRIFKDMQKAGVDRIDFMDDLGLDWPGALRANSFDVTADSGNFVLNREKMADTRKPRADILEICELQFCFAPVTHEIPIKLLTMPEAEFKALVARLGKERKARLAAEDKARAKKEAQAKKAAKTRRYQQYLKLAEEFGGTQAAKETTRKQSGKKRD